MRENGTAYGRGQHGAGEASRLIVDQCRSQVARLLGISAPAQVVFTFNCTDSLNLVLRGLLRPGDRVVTTMLEHNSVLRPLTQLKTEFGLKFDLARFDPETGLVDLDQLRSLLHSSPRLLVFNHASNVTGCLQPAAEIVAMAREAGALVLMDAAQTAGHLPLEIDKLGVDFVAAAGHKGLLGPLGTGILAMRPGAEHLLHPMRCGGTGTASESLEQPSGMPARFESGNLNLPGLAGLHAATNWLLAQSVEVVHRRIAVLTDRLRDGLRPLKNVRLYCDRVAANGSAPGGASIDRVGIVAFNLEGIDCRDVAMILDQSFGIQCRAGLHCAPLVHEVLGTSPIGGTVRFSPGAFTTSEEIETAIAAVAEISRG